MGVSTDAIIAFGFDLGEERPGWLLTGDDWDAVVARDAGLCRPETKNYDDPAWSQYWDAKKAAVAVCPVELVYHCSWEYPMYFLAVYGTKLKAYRGSPTTFKLRDPGAPTIAGMEQWCAAHGVEWRTPGWYLMSMWGR